MTLKGLVLGDSHAGMLVDALQSDHLDPLPRIHLDFFVRPGDGPAGFELQGTRLVPTDPNLAAFLEKIEAPARPDLVAYDFAVIVGCGLSIYRSVQTVSQIAIVGSGKARLQALRQNESGLEPLRHPLISPDGFRQVVRDKLLDSLAFTLLEKLSDNHDLPLFIVSQPRPRMSLADMGGRGQGFENIIRFADGEQVSDAFDAAVKSISHEIAHCHVIAQPVETIVEHIFTKDRYCLGAFRMSNPGMRQAKRDVMHTNARYGALIIKHIQQKLNARIGS